MASVVSVPADDKLTTILASLPKESSHFSLEFFPPKTQAGFTNLQSRLSRMSAALRPLFVTVTWGAGGSTATKSLELAEICQRQLGVPTVLHLTCTNSNRKVVDEALKEARSIGIRNILALRGDPPREEYRDEDHDTVRENTNADQSTEEFVWAIDLVRYIRKQHGDFFCIGVAGYPEGHADESHPEAGKQSVDHDLPYLAEKVKAGADFIMTQLTLDTTAYRTYEEKLRAFVDKDGKAGLFKGTPVIPGLMPIQSYQVIKRITKLSHAKIPDEIAKRIEQVKKDDDLVKKVGVDILSEIVEEMKQLPRPEGTPRVLHFYTLNLEKSVAFILERSNLIPPPTPTQSRNDDDDDDDNTAVNGDDRDAVLPETRRARRTSSVNAQAHNRVIIDDSRTTLPRVEVTDSETQRHEARDEGSGVPASRPNRDQNLRISEGQGSLGREATWDDFPNGRWGPSHSPAFGEIDGYGPSLKVGPITARRLWGHPKTVKDVTDLFRRHVLGELESVPWSDDVDLDSSGGGAGALKEETKTIRQELLALIEEKGFLTLASQPAVNSARSDDPVFGWGPRGEGFIFQKAFVEFFCTSADWVLLKQKLAQQPTLDYSWLKIDAHGRFESSDTQEDSTGQLTSKRTPGTSGVNAITWGVFRGKEIITPTIIEPEAFQAWSEEAYSIWGEWRRCFPRGSEEEKCLEALRQDMVLVNVVGQNFLGGHGGEGGNLWKTLLDRQG